MTIINNKNFSTSFLEQKMHTYSSRIEVKGRKEEAATRMVQAYKLKSKVLDLSCLGLSELPPYISKLREIVELNLMGNSIESVPEDLYLLPKLNLLNLSYNPKLKSLPSTLGKIHSLKWLFVGSTQIPSSQVKAFEEKIRSTKAQITSAHTHSLQKKLLFSTRPEEVQKKINELFSKVKNTPPRWGYFGTVGTYNLLGFRDTDIIAQRIARASTKKNDLYFLDLGAGAFAWVNEISGFLSAHFQKSHHQFHVIGVTGEGLESYDTKVKKGNVTSYKINGFNIENMLKSFKSRGFDLVNSVEFIVSRMTLCHLVDPVGTLEQAYNLLTIGNGFMFGTGFHEVCMKTSVALGGIASTHNYVIKKRSICSFDCFGLIRSADDYHSHGKSRFTYNDVSPLYDLKNLDDTFSQCQAKLIPKYYSFDVPLGGDFYGFGTYVLEQLFGDHEYTLPGKDGVKIKAPLWGPGYNWIKKYLDYNKHCTLQCSLA